MPHTESDSLENGAIIIPAYNEEENIGAVLDELRNENFGFDVIVVDDGSTDGTAEHAERTAVVIRHHINLGYGAAVQTGLKYAVSKRYEYIFIMDSDGQHVPAELEKLRGELDRGADIVIGSRIVESSGYRFPVFRRLGIWIFSNLARLVAKTDVKDITSGFQGMRLEVAGFLAEEYPVDFPDSDVIISLGRKRYKIREVPVVVRERLKGESMYASLKNTIYYPFRALLASCVALIRIKTKK